MNVYFLRHGLAVEPDEWAGRDADRPLTDEGIARMEREARGIAGLDLDLEAIVTSPLLRARQTAEIVAKRLDAENLLREDERLAYGFGIPSLHRILAEYAEATGVMLVGHEPSMSAVAGALIGDGSIEVKKGALAAVKLADPRSPQGTLIFLLPPKVLAAKRRT